jgi:hypothetical protein
MGAGFFCRPPTSHAEKQDPPQTSGAHFLPTNPKMADHHRIVRLSPPAAKQADDDDDVEYVATLSAEEVRERHSPTSVLSVVAASATTATTSAAAPEEPNNRQRRSNREASTTIVYVDGQPIKRANMYQVKGMSYVYESTVGMAVTKKNSSSSKQRPQKPRSIPSNHYNDNDQAEYVPKAPPVLSQREKDRLQRKQDIGKAIMAKVPARHAFLSHHVRTLRPFLDDKVYERIIGYNDNSNTNSTNTLSIIPPVLMQPDCITADLRDYQLIGLDWMHKMYRQNIGMILGDGMYICVIVVCVVG